VHTRGIFPLEAARLIADAWNVLDAWYCIPFVGSGIAMACRQTIERLLADAGHRGHNAPAD
jgi:hypothetical protein